MAWVAVAVGVGTAVIGAASASSDRKAANKQTDDAQRAIQEATAQARTDVNRIFPQAQEARLQGFQGAQDIFASTVPQQFQQFQQGNLQAQGTAGAAPQQIQNALLGLPVDFGFLQPQQAQTPDFSFLNQPLQPEQPEQPLQQPLEPIPQNPFDRFGRFNFNGRRF